MSTRMTSEEAEAMQKRVSEKGKIKPSDELLPSDGLQDEKSKIANPAKEKRTKYGNKRVVVDGINFDSQKEANMYTELCLEKRAGLFKYFHRQVSIPLIVNGIEVCKIRIDFVIYNNDGTVTYMDVKGFDRKTGKYLCTKDWRIKEKLFTAITGFTIKKV